MQCPGRHDRGRRSKYTQISVKSYYFITIRTLMCPSVCCIFVSFDEHESCGVFVLYNTVVLLMSARVSGGFLLGAPPPRDTRFDWTFRRIRSTNTPEKAAPT